MREESWQVIIELAVNNFQVILEVGTKVVDVKKDLLEILLDNGQDACQLDVTKAGNDVISNCMILIPDQDREFYVKTLHHLCRLSFNL